MEAGVRRGLRIMQSLTSLEQYTGRPAGWLDDLRAAHVWITATILSDDLGQKPSSGTSAGEAGHADALLVPVRRARLRDEERAALLADYQAGMTYRELRRKYGCSHGTIAKLVRIAGAVPHVRRDRRYKLGEGQRHLICEQRKDGMKLREIAAFHGISVGHVWRLVRKGQ